MFDFKNESRWKCAQFRSIVHRRVRFYGCFITHLTRLVSWIGPINTFEDNPILFVWEQSRIATNALQQRHFSTRVRPARVINIVSCVLFPSAIVLFPSKWLVRFHNSETCEFVRDQCGSSQIFLVYFPIHLSIFQYTCLFLFGAYRYLDF